jgi:hypothetical protein
MIEKKDLLELIPLTLSFWFLLALLLTPVGGSKTTKTPASKKKKN